MTNFIDCHYSQTGNGPGLFLIHGIGAAKDAWRFIVSQLSKHFSVITYDLRGHGKSPVTNFDFTFDDLIADLERLREKTKIPHKISDTTDISDKDIEKLSPMALADPCTPGNPKKLNLEDFINMYRNSINGKLF